jgi:hypothetical protein
VPGVDTFQSRGYRTYKLQNFAVLSVDNQAQLEKKKPRFLLKTAASCPAEQHQLSKVVMHTALDTTKPIKQAPASFP